MYGGVGRRQRLLPEDDTAGEHSGSVGVEPPVQARETVKTPQPLDFTGAAVVGEEDASVRGRWRCRVPELTKKVPSEFDPASVTTSPTVGANCRRDEQQMPRGRLKFGADGR